METVNAGQMMSLAALQRQDPYINKLLDVTGQVALYNFNSKANEWEKTEIEGTLFVYARSATPHHGFTIMNRLSTENLVEPINKDLEFQLQDPFLLYRNGNCEYFAQVGETDASAELNLKTAFTATEQSTPKAEKVQTIHQHSSHTMVKQITVEELFGSSLPKGPSLPIMPTQNSSTASSDPSTAYLQNQPYPTPALQTPLFPPHHSSQDPASGQRHQVPGLLPAPYALQPGSVFQSAVPRSDPQPRCSVSPLMVVPAGPEPHAAPSAPPTAYLGQDMLATLKVAMPSVNHDLHKPILAPNFLPNRLFTPHSFQEPAVRPSLQHSKEMDVFSPPPNLIKPMSAVPMSPGFAVPGPAFSLLLSPSAFQQSFSQTSAAPPAPSEPSYPSSGALEPPQAACSKTQLQDTLIHLIKSDPDFLSAIHDAYLQSVSKDFSNMKL
ncbi:mRNA-decapping enzyme 1A [Notothenia coriiceps]|uniref:5'-(N(7)-methylguanosine 5'-triphospho)-[mRNA] hydrolase n=1 Tax=Notothenia coriiceps TaxID=8208 RepID=A0A6I9MQX5_9TELE|nr:PREDICTED: mRNA-decapping enzyme 1A [Notothenia coriiceps]